MSYATPESSSGSIDAIIEQLDDWRGELLSQIRHLIKQAEPEAATTMWSSCSAISSITSPRGRRCCSGTPTAPTWLAVSPHSDRI